MTEYRWINWVCSPGPGLIATSRNTESCPRDPRGKRRENKGSTRKSDSADNELGLETNSEIGGVQEKFSCCGKTFNTQHGLRIHQGKVCQKKVAQQRRSTDHKTRGQSPQEAHHSETHPTAEPDQLGTYYGQRKPKVKWPRANDAASYKQFDNEVFKIVSRCIGSTEQKLERLAEIVYEEGKKRFGLDEGKQKKVEGKKSRLSRRQEKIAALRREKKKLRASWNEALPEEREGLKALYEDVKKQHRQIMRSERRMQRKKERHRCRRNFVKNPYKFAKGIFIESKSGNLECTKEELENHLRCTYSDPTREVEMPEIHGTRRPAEPGIPFNLGDIKKKEVDIL